MSQVSSFANQAKVGLGVGRIKAWLELGLDAKKALVLGSKLSSGSKGLGSSLIQF